MFSFVAKLVPTILPFLGKVAKGKITKLGDALIIGGAAAAFGSGAIVTNQNIVAILHEVGQIILAIGTVIAAFGFGRKAGASGEQP